MRGWGRCFYVCFWHDFGSEVIGSLFHNLPRRLLYVHCFVVRSQCRRWPMLPSRQLLKLIFFVLFPRQRRAKAVRLGQQQCARVSTSSSMPPVWQSFIA